MKTILALFVFACASISMADSPWQVNTTSANQRIWRKTSQNPTVGAKTNTVYEIATGLNYWDGAQFQPSRESLEVVGNHAIGVHAAHKLILSGNANVQGCLDLELPDGAGRLLSTVLGINLYDAGRQSLLIAELKDAQGELAAPNRVRYPSALDTIDAEVSYSFHRWGVEQFVTLQERFELPAGFDPETTLVEIWSEFFNPPAPKVTTRIKHGMEDSFIDFASMQMGPGGKAFLLNLPDADQWSGRVYKNWHVIDNRYFVIEAVRWRDIAPFIAQLPPGAGQAAITKRAVQMAGKDLRRGNLPVRQFAKRSDKKMQMASAKPPRPSLVVDWSLDLNPQSNLVLEGGKTWYASGRVTTTNLVIEPTTIVKYTNGASIEVWYGSVDCRAEPYAPAVFTSFRDGTVGEALTTNATADAFAASTALIFHDSFFQLANIRVLYATNGVSLDQDGEVTIKHSVFSHCRNAIALDNTYAAVQNALFYSVTNPFSGNYVATLEHATVDICKNFTGANPAYLYATNCLLSRVQYWGEDPPYTNAVYRVEDDSCFRTVGSSSHYLADNSPYRDIGVATKIGPELRARTTYGPIVYPYGSMLTNQDFTLTPAAQRDNDGLFDIGWHPVPIDYVFSAAFASNAIITVTPGTAIATHTHSPYNYGLLLGSDAKLICAGSPTNLVRIVRFSTVQEIANTNWTGTYGPSIYTPASIPESPPESYFRFTEFSMLANESQHIYGNEYVSNMAPVRLVDSQFRGGGLYNFGPSFWVTNCLFERCVMEFYGLPDVPFTNIFQNNLFIGGEIAAYILQSTNDLRFRDNLFDGTILSNSVEMANSHNGYLTNQNRLSPTNWPTDVILTSLTYQAGPLGRYYLPTNSPLVNTGSVTNAALKGFYWYTSFTNQTLEATNHLNIGKLWVAFQTNNPTLIIDDDFDGDPNHDEDINGDGDLDSGETDWTNPNDWGFKILITHPSAGSIIP